MKGKREPIIQAAIKVFAHEGLSKGRIDDIAKEAGVGKGTVYEYFRSKEELFDAIVEGVIQQVNAMFDTVLQTKDSPRAKLERCLHELIDMTLIPDFDDAIILMTEIWAQGARGQWHGGGFELVAMYSQLHSKVKAILKEGIEAGEFRSMNLDGVASLLLAFGDGLMWQYILFPEKDRFEKLKEEAIRSFMKGIVP
ncbi:MAG: TetR/AcrR family transcriptional regulator [Candidatus Neomarinimicrobiota bacterium]